MKSAWAYRWTLGLALCLAPAGCVVRFAGEPLVLDGGTGSDASRDAGTGPTDGQAADGRTPDSGSDAGLDAGPDAGQCTGTTFECLTGGGARICDNGSWVELGSCFLGCDAPTGACRTPSSVDPDELGIDENELGSLSVPSGETYRGNTDTGEIVAAMGTDQLRAAGTGVISGVGYYQVSQGGGLPGLGVFVAAGMELPAGSTLILSGSRAFVLLSTADVTLSGIIDAGADNNQGGPGGFNGGAAGTDGDGPCPGTPGDFADCTALCSSGSGGGGFGGAGGDGGEVDCSIDGGQVSLTGGPGDGPCGTAELAPLLGGSGGAGGTLITLIGNSSPGAGGGGGGAVQLSVRGTLTFGAGGGIMVPGEGGGQTINGGGAGGGAGGAILLEALTLQAQATSFLTANGGGGGGGDCS